MKGFDLYEKTAYLDPAIVNGAAVIKKSKPNHILRYAALAACVCLIATAAVLPGLNQSQDSFLIENGVLLSYTGTDTEIVIPDSVTAISAGAMQVSSSAAEITTVTLGKNVKVIDEQAFSGLVSLTEVKVPEENGYFQFQNGILLSADGSLYVGMAETFSESEKLSSLVDAMHSGILDGSSISRFVVGRGVMELRMADAGDNAEDYEIFSGKVCSITALSAYGHTFTLTEPIELSRRISLQAFEADGHFVFSLATTSAGRKVYIFTQDSIYELDSRGLPYGYLGDLYENEADYNRSVIDYYSNGDGTLGYKRTALKYRNPTAIDLILEYCTGRDEFCYETGTVSFHVGEPVYTVQKTYSVSETFSLETAFRNWKGVRPDKDIESLDELLASNAVKYESAK